MVRKYLNVECQFDCVQFGLDMKSAMRVLRLSCADVGRETEYDAASVSAISNADTNDGLPVRKFIKICRVLGLDPADYFVYEGKIGYEAE